MSASLGNADPTGHPKLPGRLRAVFEHLEYPEPEGGIVTVVYPIMFAPGKKTAG